MESKEFDNGLTIVFWNKGSKELGIAQASLNNPDRFLVGITTRQFDYECGWRPNKEWKSTIKGFFPKEKAIQMAKEKIKKGIKETMVKSSNEKDQWHAVDFASLIFVVVKEEYDKKGRVYDCNQFAAKDQGWKHIGPWVWFALMSLTGKKYDVEIECTNDESYSIKLYVKKEDVYVTEPLVEWVGKGLEEFIVDFEEVVSMKWEKE